MSLSLFINQKATKMKKNFKLSFMVFMLFVFVNNTKAQTTYYVSVNNGNDNNAGTSAATAFKTLFKATAAMKSNTDAEVNILVESGIYKPTDGTGDNTNRDATFALFRDYFDNSGKKLKVFGGYDFSTGEKKMFSPALATKL